MRTLLLVLCQFILVFSQANFPWTIGPEGDTLRFSTDGTLVTAEMSIDGVLNRVGINTISPAASLHVVGSLAATGDVTLSSTLSLTNELTASSTLVGSVTLASSTQTQAAQSAYSLVGTLSPGAAMSTSIPANLYVQTTVSPSSGTTNYAAAMVVDPNFLSAPGVTTTASLRVALPTVGTGIRSSIVTDGRFGVGTFTPTNWFHVTGTITSGTASHISQSAVYLDTTNNPTGALPDTAIPSALYIRHRVTPSSGTTALAATLHIDGMTHSGAGTVLVTTGLYARVPLIGTNRYAILTTGPLVISGSSTTIWHRLSTSRSAGAACAGCFAMTAATTVTIFTTCIDSNDAVFLQSMSTTTIVAWSLNAVFDGNSFVVGFSASHAGRICWWIVKLAPLFV